MQTATVAALAVLALFLASAEDDSMWLPLDTPDLYSLRVVSNVRNRYATTVMISKVDNPTNESKEIRFDAVLPETAFISGFVIEMDGKVYEAYVRGKEEARQEYQQAAQAGQGAAHIQLSARDWNVVSVSVNVEAQKEVTFNLTYEELLQREQGAYNLRININPGQIVSDLSVEVHMYEPSTINVFDVFTPQQKDEISDEFDKCPNLKHVRIISMISDGRAGVKWAPSEDQQFIMGEDGIKGQLLVRYDFTYAKDPSQILVSDDGYFVHFYSPAYLQPLPKYIVFVLDVSSSMQVCKIDQLQQAMYSILDELNPHDNFTLITFSYATEVWRPEDHTGAVVRATPGNIAKAKVFVERIYPYGGSAMHSALITALQVSKAGAPRSGVPLEMVLLTDGLPDGSSDDILRDFTAANIDRRAMLYTLAIGYDADFTFLKRLALCNGGFGRRINKAPDVRLQLQNFYRQLSSPLLSRVNFTYGDTEVEEDSLTQTNFPTLLRGGELVVSGKLRSGMFLEEAMVVGEGSQLIRSPGQLAETSSVERLWAFLTVRQLLEMDAASPNQTLRDRAKDIALKYSFVTPVTSLVVVKPNHISVVEMKRACVDREVDQQKLNLSEISWLISIANAMHVTLEVNGTARSYELAINKTESQLKACATCDGAVGVCRHLANCILGRFVYSLSDFMHYFCVVDGSYVGVCCPDDNLQCSQDYGSVY